MNLDESPGGNEEHVTHMVNQNQGDVLLSRLNDLYQKRTLCDVMLVVNGRQELQAHSVVLASFSTYFREQLELAEQSTASRQCTVEVPDIEVDVLRALIKFLYTGVLGLTQTMVWHLLSAATQLGISSVRELCHEYFRSIASTTTPDAKDVPSKKPVKKSKPPGRPSLKRKREDKLPVQKRLGKSKRTQKLVTDKGQETKENNGSLASSDENDVIEHGTCSDGVIGDISASVHKLRKSRRLHAQTITIKQRQEPVSLRAKRKRGRPRKVIAEVPHMSIKKSVNNEISTKNNPRRHPGYLRSSTYNLITRRLGKLFSLGCLEKKCNVKVCSKTFKLYAEFQRHFIAKHVPKRSFSCTLCPRRFCSAKLLVFHMELSHPGYKRKLKTRHHKCAYCKRIFRHSNNLAIHINTSHMDRNVYGCNMQRTTRKLGKVYMDPGTIVRNSKNGNQCSSCGKLFTTLAHLKMHMKTVHSKPKENIQEVSASTVVNKRHTTQWTCQEEGCQEVAKSHKDLLNHMKACHQAVMYHCPNEMCNYCTPIQIMMSRHHKNKHTNSKRCEHCGKDFRKRYFLKLHLHSKHGIHDPTIKIHKCPQEGCGYETFQKYILDKHIWRHTADKAFTCSICSKKLKTEKNLDKHMKKVHLNVRPFVCDQCGADYGELSELKVHIQRHSAEKQFKCEHCNYESHDKGNFQSHLWAKHKVKFGDKVKLFKCNVCDYTCDRKTRYDQHMNSHMGIRQHKCAECGQEFLSKSTMTAHIKWKHREKHLKCEYCSYRCGSLNGLREHVRVQHTHRNVKPYKCAYCEYRCAVSGNCRKHVMNRHKGLPVKWEKVCDKWGPNNDRPVLAAEKTLAGHPASNMNRFNQSIERIMADSSLACASQEPPSDPNGSNSADQLQQALVESMGVTSEVEISVQSVAPSAASAANTEQSHTSESIAAAGIKQTEQPAMQPQQQQPAVTHADDQPQDQLMFPVYQTVIPGQHDYTQNVSFYQLKYNN